MQQHQTAAPLQGHRFDALLSEFAASAMSAGIAALGSPNRTLIFAATARACGPFDTGMGRSRPVSVNALAASLERPFETIRRQANMLIETGLVVRNDAGLSVPLHAIADPRAARMTDRCHDLLVRLVEDARAANLMLPEARPSVAYDPRAGVGIALDLLLATVECHSERHENWTRLALLFAIEWASHRFAHPPAPDAPTAGVKPSMVARIVGLPYATVSRNIEMLVADGKLRRLPDGLVIAPKLLAAPAAAEARIALANRARQLLGRLAQLGFPLEQPALAYIERRPPLPALG
ncbi:hypothetical protein [Sphingomonas sp. LT1P40]|uniref:hypothetical protein n=1 Tax=Alteristakelama amylovorans TaxID=3096166 RepID=UPI002FC8E9F3